MMWEDGGGGGEYVKGKCGRGMRDCGKQGLSTWKDVVWDFLVVLYLKDVPPVGVSVLDLYNINITLYNP